MKTRNFLIALWVVVLTAGTLQAEELSNTRRAEVTLRITTDTKLFPMGDKEDGIGRLTDIMFRPEMLEAVWQEVIGVDHWNDTIEAPVIEHPREVAGLQTARIQLIVTIPEDYKPAAKEFLGAYIKKLESALQKEYNSAQNLHRSKLEIYIQRKQDVEANLHELLRAQSSLGKEHGKLDKESVRQRIIEHKRAKFENALQQAILEKRVEELTQQISIRSRTTDTETIDITMEIKNLQEIRGQAQAEYNKIDLARAQYANKADSQKEMLTIKNNLSKLENRISDAKTEIDKLNRQEQKIRYQANEDVRELIKQLRETTMQLEELEIKKRALAHYDPGDISSSIRYEWLEVEIEAAKENLRRAIIQNDEAALEYNLLRPPTVSYNKIVSLEATAKKKWLFGII